MKKRKIYRLGIWNPDTNKEIQTEKIIFDNKFFQRFKK